MSTRCRRLAAWTRIGGQDQLEACRIASMHLAASEGDHAGLQRRTQRLDDGGLELWRLIEKEHTFVSQWSVKFLNRIPA
jgi:hypothetical protein